MPCPPRRICGPACRMNYSYTRNFTTYPAARERSLIVMVDPARARKLAKRIGTIVATAIDHEIKDLAWRSSRSPIPR